MNIEIELKSGSDREIVASLRKIVGLPVPFSERVRIAKELLAGSVDPAPQVPDTYDYNNTERRVFPKQQALAERMAYHANNHSSIIREWWAPPSAAEFYSTLRTSITIEECIAVAKVLTAPHYFAWARYVATGAIRLLIYPCRLGVPRKKKGGYKLLTDWHTEIPPVPPA